MIHDSGSFVVEYLYVNKPVMRTVNDVPLKEQFDDFALSCLEQYYMGNNEQDIEVFIQNVINNIDPLKDQRTNFISEVLMPKGSPSQNIINDISLLAVLVAVWDKTSPSNLSTCMINLSSFILWKVSNAIP